MLKSLGSWLYIPKVSVWVVSLGVGFVMQTASAGGLASLLAKRGSDASCSVDVKSNEKMIVMQEIFPDVIYRTPGGDAGAAQLFEPLRKIAVPLANLGARCLLERGGSAGLEVQENASRSCAVYSQWIDELVREDALRFDRRKHDISPMSFVTGTLSGNLTLRPIALYSDILRREGLIQLAVGGLFDDWLLRRATEYDNYPLRLRNESAQNLILNSVVTALVVGIATNTPRRAMNRAENVYKLYLDTARSDGSLPYEARRGVSALKYSNMAVGELVMLAELMETQGRNLYDYEGVTGVNIHQAVEFLALAFADESVIAPYAKENYAPTDKGESRQARQFAYEHLGWMSIYLRRFPGADNSTKLQAILQSERVNKRPHFDEILGDVSGCVW